MMKPNKYVLGVAGYIGSGKTTAGMFFQKLGARFIDADEVVDSLYQQGEDGYRKIKSFFGEEYFKNGELNRKKLAKAVFGDPKKLRILHDLIHPLVTNRIRTMIDKSGPGIFIVEATYFEKKHLQALIDGLLWIECPREILFQRLNVKRGLTKPLFEKILRFQVKPLHPDFIVENSGSPGRFQKLLLSVWEQIRRS